MSYEVMSMIVTSGVDMAFISQSRTGWTKWSGLVQLHNEFTEFHQTLTIPLFFTKTKK